MKPIKIMDVILEIIATLLLMMIGFSMLAASAMFVLIVAFNIWITLRG